ncbi:MAG TPA: hypothetical protein VK700_12975 [Steroidobacteraceae bacterium]|nr:hypothetical protein [Steroidobacteraceae bacterium]
MIAVIRELAGVGPLPSGAAVRVALEQRYQSRGGVARIYRLLASEQSRLGGAALSPIAAGLLEQENLNLREQLKAARQREDAHQAHWNREVGRLRERVDALQPLVHQASVGGAGSDSLRRQVEEADTRTGQLEVQIRTFGPAAHRGPSGK